MCSLYVLFLFKSRQMLVIIKEKGTNFLQLWENNFLKCWDNSLEFCLFLVEFYHRM